MYKNEQAKKGIGEIMSGLSLKYRLLKLILKLIGFKKHFNGNERDIDVYKRQMLLCEVYPLNASCRNMQQKRNCIESMEYIDS